MFSTSITYINPIENLQTGHQKLVIDLVSSSTTTLAPSSSAEKPAVKEKTHNFKPLAHNNNIYILLPSNYLNHPVVDINSVKHGLSIYLLSLKIFEDALNSFINCKYRMFDALVGNNSCYLVSYIIFILAKKINSDEIFLRQLVNLVQEIKNLQLAILQAYQSINYDFLQFSSLSLLDFINNQNLLIDFDVDFIYLCLAFGCSLTKEKNTAEHEEINYEILLSKYKDIISVDIKKKSTIKLIKHWQKNISYINIATIQIHSKKVSSTNKLWANYLFSPYILKDERDRLCTPSLYAQMTIYDLLLRIPQSLIGLQINIIEKPKTHIVRFTLYYETQGDGTLKILTENDVPLEKPLYMFAGCRYINENSYSLEIFNEIKESFRTRPLKDLIFAHEVTYPQYPNSLAVKEIKPKEPFLIQEILRLKKFKGFSLEDPSDLCLTHIFIDDTSTQLDSLNELPIYLPAFSNKKSSYKTCDQTNNNIFF